MIPPKEDIPLLKYCQKRIHQIPIEAKRCAECRTAYYKQYREDNREYLAAKDLERYIKLHPNHNSQRNALSRQEAIDLYNANPKNCKECGEAIRIRPKEKMSQLKKRQFCDRKCSSAFNSRAQKTGRHCKKCGSVFSLTEEHKSCVYCPVCTSGKRIVNIGNLTKGEMFARRCNWQSARSSIRRDADTTYRNSGRPRSCAVCGYSRYIEVAHIKEVKSFPSTALICEINHIDNLVAMCRNHHWETDHGFLKFNAGCFEEITSGAASVAKSKKNRESTPKQGRLFPAGAR